MKKVTDVFRIDKLLLDNIVKRAYTGKPLIEHMGSTRTFPSFDNLMFLPNQLKNFMLMDDVNVSSKTIIGPKAEKPMELNTPMMITAMTYGVVSKAAKIALAKASSMAGTNANSGEGGFHLEERQLAQKYVVQYNRGSYSNDEQHLKLADMIEIKWGQGANPGIHSIMRADQIDEDLRQVRNLKPGEDSYMPPHHYNINNHQDLKNTVSWLKELTGGVPIAIKFCAADIKGDIDVALYAGADVIVIDTAQGGTGGSLVLTENDFGVPTMPAAAIAGDYITKKGLKNQISLIIAGGIRTPGDVMKAIALGADATYSCTMFLLAMTIPQNQEYANFDSPLKLIHYNIPESKIFDIDKGAQHLANYLNACTEEIKLAARLLGIDDIHKLSREHLYAMDALTSQIAKVKAIYDL